MVPTMLETKGDLAAPQNWAPLAGLPVTDNDRNVRCAHLSTGNRFYRLRLP